MIEVDPDEKVGPGREPGLCLLPPWRKQSTPTPKIEPVHALGNERVEGSLVGALRRLETRYEAPLHKPVDLQDPSSNHDRLGCGRLASAQAVKYIRPTMC